MFYNSNVFYHCCSIQINTSFLNVWHQVAFILQLNSPKIIFLSKNDSHFIHNSSYIFLSMLLHAWGWPFNQALLTRTEPSFLVSISTQSLFCLIIDYETIQISEMYASRSLASSRLCVLKKHWSIQNNPFLHISWEWSWTVLFKLTFGMVYVPLWWTTIVE